MEVRKDCTLGQKREHRDYTVDCHKDKELICKNSYKECCAMIWNMLWKFNMELPVFQKETPQASKNY